MNSESFKIIAIRPLEGCTAKYLKILEVGVLYRFMHDYEVNIENEEEQISFEQSIPDDFYGKEPFINICAIVGQNGSGKSTLMELIYVGFYNLSRTLRILEKRDEDGEAYKQENDVKFDLYFSIAGVIYKMRFDVVNPILFEFNENGIGFKSETKITSKQKVPLLFYNLVINYSLYSLNCEEVGHWVNALFHKNDAYQVPVVLNPFRDKGVININNENNLVRSRMLSNILIYNYQNKKAIKQLFNQHEPREITFELDKTKFIKKRNGDINFEFLKNYEHRVFPIVYKVFFGDEKFYQLDSDVIKLAKEYILQKMRNITWNYSHYFQYKFFYGRKGSQRLETYVEALYKDHSHITYKLRQALNFLRFGELQEKYNSGKRLEINILATTLRNILKNNKGIAPIELLPPPFFKTDIVFKDVHHTLSALSSGEKQKIYSTASLMYHLNNIESAHLNKVVAATNHSRELIHYKYINIVFDEVELYYHPEFQRAFIKNILDSVASLRLKYIKGINFIFLTHSPFILSDIPRQYVLFLESQNGISKQVNPISKNTFAANIHELLSTSFFLNNGLIGEFSKDKIQDVIDWCLNEKDKRLPASFKQIVDVVDDPIIKVKLVEMVARKQGLNVEIEQLLTQRDYIQKRIQDLEKYD